MQIIMQSISCIGCCVEFWLLQTDQLQAGTLMGTNRATQTFGTRGIYFADKGSKFTFTKA